MDVTRRSFIMMILLISGIQFCSTECKVSSKEPNTPQELFDEYYQILPSETWQKEMPRSSESDICIQLYSSKEYEAAIEKMAKLAETTPQKDQWVLRLYWGLCHLNLNQTIEAYTLFNQIDPNSSVGEMAEWYKALAFLKVGKLEQAKASLKTLQKGVYASKASELTMILSKE